MALYYFTAFAKKAGQPDRAALGGQGEGACQIGLALAEGLQT